MSDPYTLGKLTRQRSDGTRYWSFCIIWHTDTGRKRHSLGTTDRVTADALARQVWAGLSKAGPMDTVGDLVDAYLASLDKGSKDERRKREAWVACRPYFAALKPHQIDEGVSLGYPAWRQRAANTMRHELGLIQRALTWAHRNDHLAKVPPILLPAMPEPSVGHLSKPDFRKLLEGCHAPHIKLFAMLAAATGGRKSALLQARWDQVDFDRAILDLNARGRSQTGKYRAAVPLNDLIMPALREAKAGAMTDHIIEHNGTPCLDVKKGFAAAAQRAGIKAHPHMLRHSAAVWMAEDRVPMQEIAAFLGHRNINITTRIYARYHPDHLRVAARSLTW
ncbi:tyrosine-type recombinase/integrase [Tsuneonella sp. HG222]